MAKAEQVLTERISGAEIAAVLSATPEGSAAASQRLLREVRYYQPNTRSSATDLASHIRIHLFALIDIMWWGHAQAFVTDADLLGSADLIDLEPLRHAGQLRFQYRRQARSLPAGWPGRPTGGSGRAGCRAPRACVSPGPAGRW